MYSTQSEEKQINAKSMSVKVEGLSINAFMDAVDAELEAIDSDVLDAVEVCARRFVADARSINTYTDQTGNLRSSIGYIIYRDGREERRNFGKNPGTGRTDGSAGLVAAENYAAGIDVPERGICVVVVAGMRYAEYVEAKGKDVITNSLRTMLDGIPVTVQLALEGR